MRWATYYVMRGERWYRTTPRGAGAWPPFTRKLEEIHWFDGREAAKNGGPGVPVREADVLADLVAQEFSRDE